MATDPLQHDVSVRLLHPVNGTELVRMSEYDSLDYAMRVHPHPEGTFALMTSRTGLGRAEVTRLLGGSPVGLLLALTRPVTTVTIMRRGPTSVAALRSLVDARLVVWWRPPGGMRTIDYAGTIRHFAISARDDRIDVTLRGPDYNELMDRRVVAYAAQSAQADKTGAADDSMKAVIRENLGSDATDADRDISNVLSVHVDLGAGTSVAKAFSYKNVRQAIEELAETSRATPATGVWYRIVPTGSGFTCEFRTRIGRWGQDLRSGESRTPVLFSLRHNNMANPRYEENYSDEVNVVYGLGQGQESNRVVTEETDDARIARSPLNRRETSYNASRYDATQSDEMQDAVQAVLNAGRPQRRLTFEPLETESVVMGRDYDLGSLVTAEFLGIRRSMHFSAKRVRIDENGRTVTAVMEELDV